MRDAVWRAVAGDAARLRAGHVALAPAAGDTAARAASLRQAGCQWVLAKGGDEADEGGGEVINTLFGPGAPRVFRWPRLAGRRLTLLKRPGLRKNLRF